MESFFQRWKATIYFTISTVLAFTAFSIALHSTATPHHPPSPSPPPPPTNPRRLSTNATLYLRHAGFSVAASFLIAYPETFLSSPNSTIFAVKDSFLSSAVVAASPPASSSSGAAPRLLLKQLLQYHTSPLSLPMSEILKIPPGTCLPTLVNGQSIVVTKIDVENRTAEINGVKISNPDLVLEGWVVIHGVSEPFSSMDTGDGRGLIHPATCDASAGGRNSSLLTDSVDFRNLVHWSKIVQSLSSKGFVSFAVGLNSVLDGIRKDYKDLKSVTVFSPPDFSVVGSSSSPVMDRVVRIHIVPRRISYDELMNLAKTAPSLKTMLPGHNLEVKLEAVKNNATAGRLTVNGVEVLRQIFSSDKYIVHAISKALEISKVSKKKSSS